VLNIFTLALYTWAQAALTAIKRIGSLYNRAIKLLDKKTLKHNKTLSSLQHL